MEPEELAEVVRECVAQVIGVTADEITRETDLRVDYEVDSLELMEIGTRLEGALGTRIDAEDLMGMENVGDAVDLIGKHLQEVS
ncbi:acyl carrier protein [Nocardiopsis aegyptia]|uniref:Acyl carrier protein n=1 Tax=Nocardiopsis aegyptia TaxID=220378 RepID=A0A7Z0EPN2_9ACTN|nr:acyl carrier protein [Nocardiopsis aegyptia]NYJ35784.1 acyl carrier protein [Nocardiopsis aegyptia]